MQARPELALVSVDFGEGLSVFTYFKLTQMAHTSGRKLNDLILIRPMKFQWVGLMPTQIDSPIVMPWCHYYGPTPWDSGRKERQISGQGPTKELQTTWPYVTRTASVGSWGYFSIAAMLRNGRAMLIFFEMSSDRCAI